MTRRREFLKSATAALASAFLESRLGNAQGKSESRTDSSLPRWQPGTLEIHHIDTGRGNSTLVLYPDGTSLLVDAGDAHSAVRTMSPARPNASRRSGEWIARYVARQLDRAGRASLDRMLLTHFHGDHVGEVTASSPPSRHGTYRLAGASDVAEILKVHELVDRGWPDYNYPALLKDPTSLNYIAFAKSMAARGARVERAVAGSETQLSPRRDRESNTDFEVRILAVNGDVWTGKGAEFESRFPPVSDLPQVAMPTENMCCIALRVRYGAFRYYAGGDLCNDTVYGRYPWHDIETPVAEAAGPVSVATANHHGYFDACGPAMVRALRPRVWILPTWHVSHPDLGVLSNLLSEDLYPGERTVFATNMAPAALLTNDRFAKKLAGTDGHVVVRVPEGGRSFTVHVMDAQTKSGMILASFGPFQA